MTIALAIQEADGVVLAADTLISSDYVKGNEPKIVRIFDPMTFPGAAAIAGAGDMGYMQACMRGLAETFKLNPQSSSRDLKSKFEQHLYEFYDRHVIPFAQFPDNERPELELLIGVYRDEPMMYVTDHNLVYRPLNGHYATIGRGSNFADILLHKFWRPSNVRAAEILAAYIVFRTKEAVETCGNYTSVVTVSRTEEFFKDGSKKIVETAKHIEPDRMDSIEHDFRVWWTSAEHGLLWDHIAEAVGTIDPPTTPSNP